MQRAGARRSFSDERAHCIEPSRRRIGARLSRRDTNGRA
jgi:hypothetical protein